MLDLRGRASFTDFFVICSADSPRQVSAIANELEATLKRQGVRPHHREGADDSGWVLVDLSDVIVHIFSPADRSRYDLESVWEAAPRVVRVQ